MLAKLGQGKKLVGVKQSTRAVKKGQVRCAFIALDADPMITGPFEELCHEKGAQLVRAETMDQLGLACGIQVGAAVAVLLK